MENFKKCSVTILVSNLEKAIAFYTKDLGLQLQQQYGSHYAEINAAGVTLGLHPTSQPIVTGNSLSIGLAVDQFDTTLENLKSKGIEFKVRQDGPVRLAHFSDPDNNPLFLVETM